MRHQSLQTAFSFWTDRALTVALIGIALSTIIIALVIKNKWIKAGVLAYEVLP